jgi:hypothetical protein
MSTARYQELAGPPAPQLCGRCRQSFAGDDTLSQGLDTGWWACPPCRELLLGRGALATPTWKAKARR